MDRSDETLVAAAIQRAQETSGLEIEVVHISSAPGEIEHYDVLIDGQKTRTVYSSGLLVSYLIGIDHGIAALKRRAPMEGEEEITGEPEP